MFWVNFELPTRILEITTFSFAAFKIKIIWYVDFILNRNKFTCITKVPKYLPKRVYIEFNEIFKVCRRNCKLYNFELERGFYRIDNLLETKCMDAPTENGMSRSGCTTVFVTSSIKRSGRKTCGSEKWCGSKCDVVKNPITMEFFGIQYPATSISSVFMWGKDILAEKNAFRAWLTTLPVIIYTSFLAYSLLIYFSMILSFR